MASQDRPQHMPSPAEILPGRTTEIPTAHEHAIFLRPLKSPVPQGFQQALFGMGCFWGVERKFWQQGHGIYLTAVGYAAGSTPNPTYEEVCTGMTGHNEVVLITFDPRLISYDDLLRVFWENHDPTQGMKQGGDIGTQYRSGIYTFTDEQKQKAESTKAAYEAALHTKGFGAITTEILPAPIFYYAEDYHQQYLHKNPQGYCGIGGTGVSCPIGLGLKSA